MTAQQIEQFNKIRAEYLRDLERLRTHYLKRFFKILKPNKD